MELMHSKFKPQDTFTFRFILTLCGILLIAFREPDLLMHPRLWAEEGCVFYQFALHNSVWAIFTTAHVGYLTLFNSIVSALQAKVFSIEFAAIVSTYMGFLVQLIPVYIIAFTRHSFWDTPLKKIFCICIVIVATAPELSLNTTNSHFIFGLITFLIMILPATVLIGIQKHIFRLFLFIGGLTGPASMLFTPVFILKAWREKSKEKYIQAGVLSVCFVIQLIVILYAILYNNTYHRLSKPHFTHTIYSFFVDNFSMLPHTSTSYLHPSIFYLGISFGMLMFVFYAYLFLKNIQNSDYFISLLSLVIVGTLSTLGSLDMAGSPRYAYIPTCIFLMVLVSETFKTDHPKNKTRYIAPLVLILCLTTNSLYYKYGMRNVYASGYPKWADEVAKWRTDNTYAPKVHPGTDAGQCVRP